MYPIHLHSIVKVDGTIVSDCIAGKIERDQCLVDEEHGIDSYPDKIRSLDVTWLTFNASARYSVPWSSMLLFDKFNEVNVYHDHSSMRNLIDLDRHILLS